MTFILPILPSSSIRGGNTIERVEFVEANVDR